MVKDPRRTRIAQLPVYSEADLFRGFRQIMKGEAEQGSLIGFVARTSAPATLANHVAVLSRVANAGFPVTILGLASYIADAHARDVRLHATTLANTMWAMSYMYKVMGKRIPRVQWTMVKLAVKRYAIDHPCEINIKGVISVDQFWDLYRAAEKVDGDLATGMMLQMGFGLRPGQVRTLKRKQFVNTVEDGWHYTGDRFKVKSTEKPLSGVQRVENHSCVPELNTAVALVMGRFNAYSDELICPTFKVAAASKMFKKVGEAEEWNKGENALLNFNGMHCIRHSSIAQARASGGTEAAKRRGAHETLQMLNMYSQTNEQRVAVVKRKRGRQERRTTLRELPVRVPPLKSEAKRRRALGTPQQATVLRRGVSYTSNLRRKRSR